MPVDATKGSERRAIRALAWPAVAQALLHTAYGFNDYVFVARLEDGAATAALSAAFGVGVVLYGINEIVSVGAHTLVAQLTGGRAYRHRVEVLALGLVLTVLVGAVVSVVGATSSMPIAETLNLSPAALVHGDAYLQVLLTWYPIRMAMHLAGSVLRGMGRVLAPVAMEVTTLLLNVLGNGLFVLGWFGAPKLGVAGAAWATVFAAFLPSIFGLAWAFLAASREANVHAGMDRSTAWRPLRDGVEMLRIGAPASLIPVMYGLVYLAVNRVAGSLGEPAQAALGASMRGVEWVGFSVCLGYHLATTVAVGQCVGAGLARRTRHILWTAVFEAAIATQIVGLVMAAAPHVWISVVVDDPLARQAGSIYVGWMGAAIFLIALDTIFEGALIGMGRTAVPMRISVSMNLIRIPLASWFVYGAGSVVTGSLFAVGAAPDPGATAELLVGFKGITITVLVSALGKAVWGYLVVRRLDFDEVVRERRERLGLAGN